MQLEHLSEIASLVLFGNSIVSVKGIYTVMRTVQLEPEVPNMNVTERKILIICFPTALTVIVKTLNLLVSIFIAVHRQPDRHW